jgi:curved DNA-binding protein CbpA
VDNKDYYRLLALPRGTESTPEEIRTHYRTMLLRYHPDKTGGADDNPHFVAIQAAYDTLSDAEKKRGFDSQYEFDDSSPSATQTTPQNFFELWRPVFQRNARFSQVGGGLVGMWTVSPHRFVQLGVDGCAGGRCCVKAAVLWRTVTQSVGRPLGRSVGLSVSRLVGWSAGRPAA